MKILVFSLDTKERQPAKDEYNTMKQHLLTSEMAVSDAKGVYGGQEENSFICLVDQDIQEKMIMAIAHAYKQESMLEVELPSRKTFLRFIGGAPNKYLGLWSEAGPAVSGDFTLNMDNMKVYSVDASTPA